VYLKILRNINILFFLTSSFNNPTGFCWVLFCFQFAFATMPGWIVKIKFYRHTIEAHSPKMKKEYFPWLDPIMYDIINHSPQQMWKKKNSPSPFCRRYNTFMTLTWKHSRINPIGTSSQLLMITPPVYWLILYYIIFASTFLNWEYQFQYCISVLHRHRHRQSSTSSTTTLCSSIDSTITGFNFNSHP
jgi:hypothetical protein